MRKYLFTIVTLFCVTTLYANEDKYIKDALLKYNYGIIKMGKSGETQFFKEFVKEDVAVKLQVWFESWKFSNLTYIAKINDLRFSPIAYNENNATIRTMENWTFSYVNLATKNVELEPTNIFYKMQYTLQKQNGKWMIIAIKHLGEEIFTKPNIHKPSVETKKEEPKEKIPTH
ncbi:MAG: hypothetical protein L3J19_02410 [Sulfurimonas sp.]|nr:hypothetical protein [Sulfurimonas sp.]